MPNVFPIALLAFSLLVDAAVACPVAIGLPASDSAQQLAVSKLSQLMACDASDPMNDRSPCNTFAGRGLEAIYHVDDFKDGRGGYLSANQIADFVAKSSSWHTAGGILDKAANICAQALANQAYPVVVVLKEAGHGHVALIIPGLVVPSPNFGFPTANSASFLFDKPGKSYIGGPLSKSFKMETAAKAVFFYRANASH